MANVNKWHNVILINVFQSITLIYKDVLCVNLMIKIVLPLPQEKRSVIPVMQLNRYAKKRMILMISTLKKERQDNGCVNTLHEIRDWAIHDMFKYCYKDFHCHPRLFILVDCVYLFRGGAW